MTTARYNIWKGRLARGVILTAANFGIKALPCPFCGKAPVLEPKDDKEASELGDAFGKVYCANKKCAVAPRCDDGSRISDTRGWQNYVRMAVKRWNRRAAVKP